MPPQQQQSPPPPLNKVLVAVTAAAAAELDPVWSINPSQIAAALKDVLPALLDKWSTASASAAADWYDELRAAMNIGGRFTALLKPIPDLGAQALAGWGAEPLKTPELGITSAQSRVEGGVQKRLVNAANLVVTDSTSEDPQAHGYMRRTRPGACKFCIMVASRGAVYTRASSTFACHEHCYCEAIPAWGGQARPVGPYKPSERPNNATERVRVKKWIADNL